MSKKRNQFDGFTFIIDFDHIKDPSALRDEENIVTQSEVVDNVERAKEMLLELHCMSDVVHQSIKVEPLVPEELAMKQLERISKMYANSIGCKDGIVDSFYLLIAMKQMITNMINQSIGAKKRAGLPLPTTHFWKIDANVHMDLNEVLYDGNEDQDVLQQLLGDI